ncbi:MAG: DUF4232 domain-containing protein [Actinobacteria bacterium]|nr:DUF4232 domain-containing protein [Actinomycetota bacterium]
MRKAWVTLALGGLVVGAFFAGRIAPGSNSAVSTSSSVPKSSSSSTTGALTSSTTSTKPGLPTCLGAQISTTIPLSSGAAGSVEGTVDGKNLSSLTCTMSGYPSLQLQASPGGSEISTTIARGGTFSATSANGKPVKITVAPGKSFRFQFQYSNVPMGSASCPSSSGLLVTWPGANASASLPYSATVCGGGLIRVSHIYAG